MAISVSWHPPGSPPPELSSTPVASAREHPFERGSFPAGDKAICKENHAYTDIIVAVHGIGAQSRNSTVRNVANRLAQSETLLCGEPEPFSPQPLGYFHREVQGRIKVVSLDRLKPDAAMASLGFSEVFWADIPQAVIDEGRTLEETKAWARTVASRARRIFLTHTAKKSPTTDLRVDEPDFSLASEVLDELADTIQVLEHLFALAEKAGMAKFDLDQVLKEYLGDVQLMTEFSCFREQIIARFHEAMREVHEQHPHARLHIVAHSEGTVVSFLGLLQAVHQSSARPATPEDSKSFAWVDNVRGFMTLGSPLDKHILLWPELFENFHFEAALPEKPKIKWCNYYDYGDPVGFKLDITRKWLKEAGCTAFDFTKENDHGFARYLLPGKAHNDYWGDPVVFEHFVFHVIRPRPTSQQREAGFGTDWWFKMTAHPGPRSRLLTFLLSPALPYVASAVVLFAGVLLFYKAVAEHIDPPMDSLHNFVRYMTMGTGPKDSPTSGTLFLKSLGVTSLIAGATLLARWRRLTREKRWSFAGLAAFGMGAFFYAWLPRDSRDEIGAAFAAWPQSGIVLTLLLILGVTGTGLTMLKSTGSRLILAGGSIGVASCAAFLWRARWNPFEPVMNSSAPEFHFLLGAVIAAFFLPWCQAGSKHSLLDCQQPRYWPGLLGAAVFLLVSLGYGQWLPGAWRASLDQIFERWYEPATFGTLVGALLVALIGLTVMTPPKKGASYSGGRRTRWFRRGMRPLIACGAVGITLLVLYQMFHRPPALSKLEEVQMTRRFINNPELKLNDLENEAVRAAHLKAAHIKELVRMKPPIWPVILFGGIFLYLWWFSALLFDLSFVWHHYIREGAGVERLAHWRYPIGGEPAKNAANHD
jgi:multidrug transporter EmrE-like cation transporter